MPEDLDARLERLRTMAANHRAEADLLDQAADELDAHRDAVVTLTAEVTSLAQQTNATISDDARQIIQDGVSASLLTP